MSNIYGRQVVVALTNKSGGSVIAGDVVVVDTSNNLAFTTSTAGAVTGGVGVAQETIASNASGRVLIGGYAALVNVNASVTRGNFGKTYTVVKQATDAGASRVAGTFCQFLTGGTTPDANVFNPDLGAGSGLSDPMTTRGDIIYRDSSNVTNRLAIPAAGQVLGRSGSDLGAVYPPGYEFSYVESTSSVTVNTTSEGTANTVVTSGSVAYDGSTAVFIEFWCARVNTSDTSGSSIVLLLYEDSTLLGRFGLVKTVAAANEIAPVFLKRRRTPSNASHTYTVKAYSTSGTTGSALDAGSGGTGVELPLYIRVVKA